MPTTHWRRHPSAVGAAEPHGFVQFEIAKNVRCAKPVNREECTQTIADWLSFRRRSSQSALPRLSGSPPDHDDPVTARVL